jgi:hypothetical protein
VSCRALGFRSAEGFVREAAYGVGSGQIWMSHVSCEGEETGLEACAFFGAPAVGHDATFAALTDLVFSLRGRPQRVHHTARLRPLP